MKLGRKTLGLLAIALASVASCVGAGFAYWYIGSIKTRSDQIEKQYYDVYIYDGETTESFEDMELNEGFDLPVYGDTAAGKFLGWKIANSSYEAHNTSELYFTYSANPRIVKSEYGSLLPSPTQNGHIPLYLTAVWGTAGVEVALSFTDISSTTITYSVYRDKDVKFDAVSLIKNSTAYVNWFAFSSWASISSNIEITGSHSGMTAPAGNFSIDDSVKIKNGFTGTKLEITCSVKLAVYIVGGQNASVTGITPLITMGSNQTFTVTPLSGYECTGVTVVNDDGTISCSNNGNTYSFTAPNNSYSDIVITLTISETASA